jgi:hypothetical protein
MEPTLQLEITSQYPLESTNRCTVKEWGREIQRNGLVTTLESRCSKLSKEGDKKNQHFSKVNKQALGGRRPEAD